MNGIVLKEIKAARRTYPLEELERDERNERTARSSGITNDVEKEVFAHLRRADIEAILRAMPRDQVRAIVEVWLQPQTRSGETAIKAAARRMDRSHQAMDSLLRRAVRTFKRLWLERMNRRE